jgi:hypothetical protein
MTKFSLASLAVAAALAITPAAFADTFDYTINGSNFSANLYLTTSPVDMVNTVHEAGTGLYSILDVAGTVTVGGATHTLSGPVVETANVGSDASNLTLSADNSWLFDNLLDPSKGAIGALDWGGLLFKENTGYELNLFGSGTSLYFGDNGSHFGNYPIELTSASLVKTPEPSSLLLLGTALLGLAFLAFRKSRPSLPVLEGLI